MIYKQMKFRFEGNAAVVFKTVSDSRQTISMEYTSKRAEKHDF